MVKLRLHYGWIVVAVAFLSGLAAAGVRSSPVVYIVPLGEEFGWSRGELATVVAINLALFGLAAPIAGRLIDRFGPRIVMVGSLGMLACGVGGTIFVRQLWQLSLLWGPMIGLGAGGGASVVAATVSSRWFVAKRGLALGLLGTASSTGQTIFIPLLGLIVASFGWRSASLTMAAVVLVVLLVVLAWMRNDPADMGLEPYGSGTPAAVAQKQEGPSLGVRQALRTPEFWLLAGSFFVCGGTANGLVGTHFIPHSIDHGLPSETAAAAYGVMGLMNMAGTLFSGWLTDRVDPRRILATVFILRGCSLFMLPSVTDYQGLFIFAVIYGLDWFATVPPVVTLATARFGKKSLASIYGLIFFAHQMGAASMAFGGGQVRDFLGDYRVAFLAGGVLAICGACMASLVRPGRPRRLALTPAAA
jgi:sugar phosphate permease